MEKIELDVQKREKGKKSEIKELRKKNILPAIIYGKDFEPVMISLDGKKIQKIIKEKGHNVLINLHINGDGKKDTVACMLKELQENYMTDQLTHIDFFKVDLTHKIETTVPVEFSGVAVGVKLNGGVLVHGMREVKIKCLPNNIPEKYILDITDLDLNQSKHVSDLKVDKDVEILVPLEEVLAQVIVPKEEKEPEPVVAEGEVPAEEGAAAGEASAEEGKESKGKEAEAGKEEKK